MDRQINPDHAQAVNDRLTAAMETAGCSILLRRGGRPATPDFDAEYLLYFSLYSWLFNEFESFYAISVKQPNLRS